MPNPPDNINNVVVYAWGEGEARGGDGEGRRGMGGLRSEDRAKRRGEGQPLLRCSKSIIHILYMYHVQCIHQENKTVK